jgi:geranylgeranyl diphosphate synthase type II
MLNDYLKEKQQSVEDHLSHYFSQFPSFPQIIYEAMDYSLMAGGKRLRPILGIAVAEMYDKEVAPFLPIAAAIEMIHTYSLVHDDLPDMDNDDLRRGKPTCHKKYSPAMAILTGDALLTYAFELLSQPNEAIQPSQQIRIIHLVAKAAGVMGMVGGQVEDILNTDKKITIEHLENIHKAKTGQMIILPLLAAAVYSEASNDDYNALKAYGEKIGLAFQIADDILDVTGTEANMGKTMKKDLDENKSTYVTLCGLDRAQTLAKEIIDEALSWLKKIDKDTQVLEELAHYIIKRVN